MSLDGFISGPGETGFEHLFAWFGSGDVEVPTADPNMTLRMTKTGAADYRRMMDETGAIIVGRKLFDFTQGWGGQHPLGCPVVVLTHNPPSDWPHQQFHFVSTGIEGAVKKAVELADGKIVGAKRWRDRQPVPGSRPARRGVDRPGPGAARWRNPVVPRRSRCAGSA
jgi:dihydrofolate reductase